MSRQFAFSHRWELPAQPTSVFDALADIEHYPQWWPQVRSVRALDAHSVGVEVRSLLPYRLDLVLTRAVENQASGELRATLSGDLIGFLDVRVRRADSGSVVTLRQECVVAAPWMARSAGAFGWIMRANHSSMMRGGCRGLAAHLRAEST